MPPSSEHHVELLRFENTTTADKRLFLPTIPWSLSKPELGELLREKMSKYGLVHSVYVEKKRRDTDPDSENIYYALVDFYSSRATNQARLFTHLNLIIENQPVKVLPSNRNSSTEFPLSLWRCERLANFYLGFNGWNTELLYHRKETETTTSAKFVSAVKLTFPCRPDLNVEGVGMADAEWTSVEGKGPASMIARKRSRNAALQHAMSKLILVVVDGLKVTLEVDSSKEDPFFYDPLWEKHEVEVNVVDYEDEEEIEGMLNAVAESMAEG